MTAISRRKMERLSKLANESAAAARKAQDASQRFYKEYELIFGKRFECTKSGFEDPVVDIVEYGRDEVTTSELITYISNMMEDDGTPILFE